MSFAMINLQDNLIALSEENSALHWAVTSPEDNTPAAAVAAGHFVQVGLWHPILSGSRHSEIAGGRVAPRRGIASH